MNTVTITVGSVTNAVKAKKILHRIKIQSRLVKLDSMKTQNGCTHGLEIHSSVFYTAVKELIKEGVTYSVYPQ